MWQFIFFHIGNPKRLSFQQVEREQAESQKYFDASYNRCLCKDILGVVEVCSLPQG
jgi:hypothetical protein